MKGFFVSALECKWYLTTASYCDLTSIKICALYVLGFSCACRHGIPVSVIGINPDSGFDKPNFATCRTPKGNGILWHLYALS